jgi:hypothetical protein
MRNIVLITVGAALIAMSGAQAAASGRHHIRKDSAAVSEQVRNANNSIAWPTQAPSEPASIYSGGWSDMAGH